MRCGVTLKLLCGISMLALTASEGQAEELSKAEKAGKETALGEILVTGEKTVRSLKNTATSVEVTTSQDIEVKKPEAATLDQVLRGTPNVLYTDTVGAPVIRGVDGQGPNFGSGAFFGGTIPRARVNMDGHNLGFWETVFGSTSVWDVESVEVFRGPQTTTMGANSVAGAVIINTKDPTFTPEAAAQVQYGSRNSKRASVMFSGPLSDQLAARFALDYSGRDSFIKYVNPRFKRGNTKQDFSAINGRFKLLWEPANIPGLSAKLTVSHMQSNRPTSEAAYKPYDKLESKTTSMPSYYGQSTIGVLDLGYDFGNDIKLSNQFQYSIGRMKRVAEPWKNGGAHMTYRDISNEMRLNFGSETSEFSGVAGLYYSHVKSHDELNTRGLSIFDDKKNSIGLFSEVTWRFAERWAVTGGLRYQYDKVVRKGKSSFSPNTLNFDKSYQAFLPKIALSYDITPNVTLGGMISKGYNPGGAGLRFATRKYYTFKPETVWNYEIFARTRFLDDRLHINGNLFYSDIRNSQRGVPDYLRGRLFGNVTVNADKAKAYGLEVSADYQIMDNLRLWGSAGLMHTEITKSISPNGPVNQGNKFGRAPGHMFSIGAAWDILPELTLSADIRHTDGYYSTDDNDPLYRVSAYTTANARLSYRPNENFELYGYANNIFDSRKATWKYKDRTARSALAIVGSVQKPREFGIGLKVKY